jgi:murein DD-endopeptidase MepM/ murein hydrolase activator NlpD
MQRVKKVLRMALTPVTVMMIPHSNKRPLNIKIPLICIILLVSFWVAGTGYTFITAVNSLHYNMMKDDLSFYTDQFNRLKTTIAYLNKSEEQFRRLLSLGSREAILKNADGLDSGNIDMTVLQQQVNASMESVGEIKDYIRQKRDIYMATPKGLPLVGTISSPYGRRVNPLDESSEFHTGIDISAPSGTAIHATADGIVSFAGWSGGSGLLVVIEHGFDMATFYAHTRKILVKAGEVVKRGQVIGYVGSTGASTGPHVHYEIWAKGKSMNPSKYI